jgi:hypothetical protein
VPADRLIANTEAFIKENPKNAEGYYTLGRIHYLVFANQGLFVGAFNPEDKSPRVAPDWRLMNDYGGMVRWGHAQELVLREIGFKTIAEVPEEKRRAFWEAAGRKEEQLRKEGWKPEPLDREAFLAHAVKANEALSKAIELAPQNGLYHHTLACLYDQYLQYVESQKLPEPPAELKDVTWEKVREMYLNAYNIALAEDAKVTHMPDSGLRSIVSHEAGTRYVALMEKLPDLSEAQKKQVQEVKGHLQRLKVLPLGVVTPILFSLEPGASLSSLLAPGHTARFDLDGNGVAECWPWVKPTTGILVWDPTHSGRIASGRQLFGSATWWLLFSDGYAALNALDDNRDGKLSGAELEGIAAWFDRDSDGRSDPGEVTPVAELGIVAIATRAASCDGDILENAVGMLLNDGRAVPTFDWVTRPADGAALPLRRQ